MPIKALAYLLVLSLLCTQAYAQFGAGGLLINGRTTSNLSLDGTVQSGSSCTTTTCTVSLTTSLTNDVIIVIGRNSTVATGANISSISDTAGLTWTLRKRFLVSGGGFNGVQEEWWAPSTGALTGDTITAHVGAGNVSLRLQAFGVNGANMSVPFDTDASLPATIGSTTTGATTLTNAISTVASNTFVLAAYECSSSGGACASPTITPTTFTLIGSADTTMANLYQIQAAPLSSVNVVATFAAPGGSAVTLRFLVDALKP